MDDHEFAGWFRLAHTPGLSRRAARALLAAFGSPQAVMAATPAQWQSVVDNAAVQSLREGEGSLSLERRAHAQAWRQGGAHRHVIVLGDARYPAPLLRSEDPPLLLYAIGTPSALTALQGPSLAIVGSRQATPEGLAHARTFARQLSDAGLPVVSGLAIGIDAAAHEGALLGRSPTVAVVGTGLDIVYPRRHEALAGRIAAQGVLLSEFAPGTPALREHFPMRNRIIATLSEGTLVAEAALPSGSLITARLAAESGREVFAIPGSIHSPQSRGCHALLRQGAKLVETLDDILEELMPGQACASAQAAPLRARTPGQTPPLGPASRFRHEDIAEVELDDPGDGLLEALGHAPVTLDALAARTGLSAAALGARLLELELQQRVVRLPGGLYQQQHQA
jgi:DNA processing protein